MAERVQVRELGDDEGQRLLLNWRFSTWSLAKLPDFLVAEGVVEDISHEGLRVLLRQEGVSFQRLKTFKHSRDRTMGSGRTGSCTCVG